MQTAFPLDGRIGGMFLWQLLPSAHCVNAGAGWRQPVSRYGHGP